MGIAVDSNHIPWDSCNPCFQLSRRVYLLWLVFDSVVTDLEFHSEAGETQYVFATPMNPLKGFFDVL